MDPKTGFPTAEFLRNINSALDLLAYVAAVQDQAQTAQNTAEGAQAAADAAQITADGATPQTRTLTAGLGLTGGGNLAANRTFNVGAGTGVTVNADDVAIDPLVVATLLGVQTLANKTLTTPILASYTVAGVPSASPAGKLAYITNESGGAIVAFSDGVDWRRVSDRAVIS